MKILSATLLLATVSTALAQPPYTLSPDPKPIFAPPPDEAEGKAPRPTRAPGVPLALAVAGAQKAVETCAAKGFRASALVADTAGVPVALLSGDGSAAIVQRILGGKVYLVIKYGMSSGDVVKKAAADPALKAVLAADPRVVFPRKGGLPIMKGGEIVGAFAVSGTPGGDVDESCAAPGVAVVEAGLK